MELTSQTQAVLEAIPSGICVVGADDKIQWANQLLGDMMNESPEALIGRLLDELPLSRSEGGAPEALFSPRGRPGMRLRVITQALDTSTRMVMVSDVTGLARGSGGLDLHELSRTDLDTGLLTPKAIFQQLVSEVSRCRRYGNELSVVLIQVPGQNDEAISHVAVRLADNLRWVDFAGRLEKDSFLLVLPETTLDSANQLIGKLSPMLDQVLEGSDTQVSCAVAQWEVSDDAMGLVDRIRETLDSGAVSTA